MSTVTWFSSLKGEQQQQQQQQVLLRTTPKSHEQDGCKHEKPLLLDQSSFVVLSLSFSPTDNPLSLSFAPTDNRQKQCRSPTGGW
jgi:hypothetical protein